MARLPTSRFATYGEVGEHIDYPARSMARILDEVFDDCNDHSEPDLTVLVVNKRKLRPSKFRDRYAVDGEFDVAAWLEEVENVPRFDWPD